jgi:hypothetical protein
LLIVLTIGGHALAGTSRKQCASEGKIRWVFGTMHNTPPLCCGAVAIPAYNFGNVTLNVRCKGITRLCIICHYGTKHQKGFSLDRPF